jgi:hypothetical protein
MFEIKRLRLSVVFDRKNVGHPMYGLWGIRRDSFARTKMTFVHFGAYVVGIFKGEAR